MLKRTFALLTVTILISPLSLRACDDKYADLPGYFHFKDGITPNGPIPVEARLGDPSYYRPCSFFVFRDYGAARVVVPPAPAPAVRRPSS